MRSLNNKTLQLQATQFSISTQFSSIWPIDRNLSGATTPNLSGPGSDGKKGVPRIPQGSRFTGASPSYCVVSYSKHSLGKSYSPAEIQLMYSTIPADWAKLLMEEMFDPRSKNIQRVKHYQTYFFLEEHLKLKVKHFFKNNKCKQIDFVEIFILESI